jgi:hypothetical protein
MFPVSVVGSMVEALEKNTSLTFLDLGNIVDGEIKQKLFGLLERNSDGLRISGFVQL